MIYGNLIALLDTLWHSSTSDHVLRVQAEGATDAFQRLVKAYQNLLKYAKQS